MGTLINHRIFWRFSYGRDTGHWRDTLSARVGAGRIQALAIGSNAEGRPNTRPHEGPSNLAPPLRQERGEDEGITSHKAQRAQFFNAFRKIREEIDALNPDSIMIWGDDQEKTFGRTSSRPSGCWLTTSSSSSPFISWADAQTFGTSRRIRYSRQLGIMRVAGTWPASCWKMA